MENAEPTEHTAYNPEEAEDPGRSLGQKISEQWSEILSAFLLSLVAVGTAWTGYQASLWGGIQSTSYSQASAKRVESARASTLAGQQTTVDVIIFAAFLDAYAVDNTELAEFYVERFRDEFKPAFEAWLATDPANNPDAPPSPFAMPEYTLKAEADSVAFENEAEALFEEGRQANLNGDRYVFTTVLLASVLFFAGIATRFEWQAIRWVLLIFGALLLFVGLWNMFTLPTAGNISDIFSLINMF
jgi:hypothetical protein